MPSNKNRSRLTLYKKGTLPGVEMCRGSLPHHLRDRPICEVERGLERGWLIRTSTSFALLTLTGTMQTLPLHKLAAAAEKANITL